MTHQKKSLKSEKATKQKQDAPSREQRTSSGYRVVGRSELERRGIDISDELVISLGRTKQSGQSTLASTKK